MATAKNDKQILVGAAEFYVAAAETAFPTLAGTTKTVDSTLTGYDTVGFTQEGVEVSYEPDYGDVEVDQLLDSARIFKQSMRVTVNTTLAQATLENLIIVWGQAASTLSAEVLTLEGGALGDAPIERTLLFVGPGPRTASTNKERVYHVSRAIQTESSSHALRRSEVTALPVSFRILPTSAGSYGTVRDRVVA
jgi:hypothetical protein